MGTPRSRLRWPPASANTTSASPLPLGSQGARPTGLWLPAIEDNEAMVQFRASVAERAVQVSGRFTRAVVAFFLMVVTALAWALVTPSRADAADDQIDSFTINYEMQPSGVLRVKETIVWRFGSNSGRHGIQRDLVIREPDPDSDQDFVYGISNIKVTSPDDYVATQFSSKTTESQGGREAELNVRSGNPNGRY